MPEKCFNSRPRTRATAREVDDVLSQARFNSRPRTRATGPRETKIKTHNEFQFTPAYAGDFRAVAVVAITNVSIHARVRGRRRYSVWPRWLQEFQFTPAYAGDICTRLTSSFRSVFQFTPAYAGDRGYDGYEHEYWFQLTPAYAGDRRTCVQWQRPAVSTHARVRGRRGGRRCRPASTRFNSRPRTRATSRGFPRSSTTSSFNSRPRTRATQIVKNTGKTAEFQLTPAYAGDAKHIIQTTPTEAFQLTPAYAGDLNSREEISDINKVSTHARVRGRRKDHLVICKHFKEFQLTPAYAGDALRCQPVDVVIMFQLTPAYAGDSTTTTPSPSQNTVSTHARVRGRLVGLARFFRGDLRFNSRPRTRATRGGIHRSFIHRCFNSRPRTRATRLTFAAIVPHQQFQLTPAYAGDSMKATPSRRLSGFNSRPRTRATRLDCLA